MSDAVRKHGFAKAWAILAGAVLITVGVAGFIPGQGLVGDPDALLATDNLHNLVHLLTGWSHWRSTSGSRALA
jgi:hypothetical protein